MRGAPGFGPGRPSQGPGYRRGPGRPPQGRLRHVRDLA